MISDFYKQNETANHDFTLARKWYHTWIAFDDRYELVVWFLNEYLKEKNLKILDVACGTGIYERMLDPKIRSKQSIIWVDISGPHIEINQKLWIFNELIPMDIEDGLDFSDASFDVIILSEIIEHLFEPEKIIQECHRCLKKGGILIMTTPNLGSLQNRLSFLFTGNSGEIDYFYNFQHIRFFSKKAIKKIFVRIFGSQSCIYERGCSCIYFYPHNFPIFVPFPRFLQKLFAKFFPNSGNGFLKVYKK